MSTKNENINQQCSSSSKKLDDTANYTDSGFHSGFQESCEISSRDHSEVIDDNNYEAQVGNSQTKNDNENYTDSGIISSDNISYSESQLKPTMFVVEIPYVPHYFNDSNQLPHPLSIHAEKFFEQDDDGYTNLFLAILHNSDNAINVLINISNPHYLNMRNCSGQTALHLAVLLGQSLTVKKLINAGADLNIRDNRCNTPLHLACLNDDFNCVMAIISAIYPQKDPGERRLLVNLEQWNYDGETCFYVACKNRNLQIAKALVANGANVNARDGRSGYTSLHMAIETQSNDVLKYLCEECNSSLCIDTENYGGLTAFQLSLLTNQELTAEYLISKGATPYFMDDNNESEPDDDSSDFECDMESNQLVNKFTEIVTVN